MADWKIFHRHKLSFITLLLSYCGFHSPHDLFSFLSTCILNVAPTWSLHFSHTGLKYFQYFLFYGLFTPVYYLPFLEHCSSLSLLNWLLSLSISFQWSPPRQLTISSPIPPPLSLIPVFCSSSTYCHEQLENELSYFLCFSLTRLYTLQKGMQVCVPLSHILLTPCGCLVHSQQTV